MLDTVFGTEGTEHVYLEVGESETIDSLLPLPGGAFYAVGGIRRDGSGSDLVAARLSESGALDSAFGDQGIVRADVGSNADFVFDGALSESGLPVIVGTTRGQTNTEVFAVALGSNGALAPDFADGGVLIADFREVVTAQARALALDGTDILVAGYTGNFSAADMLLTKFDDSGVQDLSFGSEGWVVADFDGDEDEARDVLMQENGRVVIGGLATIAGSERFALIRYLARGAVDTEFNGDGRVVIEFPQGDSEAESLALQSDGKIVIGGFVVDATTSVDFALARINSDGTLDPSFGSGGLVTLDFTGGRDIVYQVLVQPDGRIIAVGSAESDNNFSNFALARFTANGDLDATFGNAGTVLFDFFSRTESAFSAVLNERGEIFAADVAVSGAFVTKDFDETYDMLIDSQDRIVVAGETVQLDDTFPRVFLLQRFLSDSTGVIFADGFE